ncbi:prephenate dehydrogenase [Heyndrickxia oleronia]|uniref:prephenate dehydrogenase n=1 Tax=Heyndrickxia oleronia TaxID=38875 RepID=UPI001B175ECD|nr:prephenate dehydrogenase [Heyndrickxia oleronia]GIN38181.1 prephenate dehydrogenase [Heyndrickxia oleronia]
MQQKIFVIGLGLIGGSVALAIKNEHPNTTIIGYDRDAEIANQAKILKVIDDMAESIKQGAIDADFIILSIPIFETEKVMEELALLPLKQSVIITDTGSTKKSIMKKAALFIEKGISFIGGHPMAGSHKSGVVAAKRLLFENAFYMLTPPEHTIMTEQVNQLKHLLVGTKSKFIELTADEHDEMTGILSHFPHIIAASLVGHAKKYQEIYPLLQRLAAGGFRDITRIASSNPHMWTDISLRNKDVLLQLMCEWKQEMQKIEQMLIDDEYNKIYQFFANAKSYRDGLPIHTKGVIHSFYDLYVDVPDYPGVISEITGYLAEERISITNIRILETREDIYGVLRISFQTIQDREQAMVCLKNRTNYELFIQ